MNNSSKGRKFLKYAGKCQSTNLLIKEGYRAGRLAHADAVYTDTQEAGRGQRGRLWYEEKGRNLALSILLTRFPPPLRDPVMLNVGLSVAVHEALSAAATLQIKWPNDILYRDCKLAGILIESSMKGNALDFVVMGVGLNIGTRHFPTFQPEACSLHTIGAQEKDAAAWAGRIYDSVMRNLSEKTAEQLRNSYEKNLYSRGVYRVFKDLRKKVFFTAAPRGIDDLGRLVLQFPGGRQEAFLHGEIEWLFGAWSKEEGA